MYSPQSSVRVPKALQNRVLIVVVTFHSPVRSIHKFGTPYLAVVGPLTRGLFGRQSDSEDSLALGLGLAPLSPLVP